MRSINIFNAFVLFCATSSHSTRASSLPPQNSTRQWSFSEIPPSKNLRNWYPCFEDFLCAVLDVPLDYHRPTGSRSQIPLIKNPAKTKPYKGMILVNPGGPGGSGIDIIRTLASQEHIPFLGSNYDGVGWDPRGIGYAIPSANCTLTPGLKIPLGPANTKRGSLDKLYGPSLPDEYFDNVYKVAYEAGQECGGSIGGPKDAGPHMSSTTVARDMVSIVDAYAESEDGKKCQGDPLLLNYWGLSYGTFLGQVFASMFPHRVGRVVLDGVLDPDETAKETGLHQVTQTDEVFSTFFLYCHLAGPSACSFYTGTTPHDIYLRFESMVSKLNATEALQQNWANSSAIWNLLQGMKGLINPAIQKPIENYPLIALALTGLESVLANLTLEVLEQLENGLPTPINPPLALSDLWSTGVACADNGGRYYGKKPSDFADTIRKFENVSWLGGEQQVVNQIFCSGWNITTVERYGGPFGGKTKNPILFVSNTLDPITPIENGRKGVRIFKGAQLLTIEGIGHTSNPLENACSRAKIGAFFVNGTLPGNDSYCPLEAGPWNITTTGPLAKRSAVLKISNLIMGLGKSRLGRV